ncbi:uncharacterized protein BDR25DRAFT_210346 [Lindgomyces ingoldianus]|uniref:Uncharacterized protein n=1 Tax=Lindgomyces ingoldianus TaxID=673940 RepID=A0ACB6RCB3_9PLEO|nr:uncharacterized protein BDR25DRAFT_210346 [Lindgomyces ingoldianus]KAF2476685.1 hypothetical protein BDR25DRAFT_210346 [Lindgomyces ingoldianus]
MGNSTQPTGNSTIIPTNSRDYYSCAGPDVKDYPPKGEWLSFNALWGINSPTIVKNNKDSAYADFIKQGIQDVSRASKVDARLILSIIMQESGGNAQVECTGYDYKRDCGIMQMRGAANFSSSEPEKSIREMIEDSVYGVSEPGDLSWIKGTFWQGNPFAAAHLYNAGSVEENLTVQVGENLNSKWYANDIASRLLGWNGSKQGCENSRKCPNHGFENRQCQG